MNAHLFLGNPSSLPSTSFLCPPLPLGRNAHTYWNLIPILVLAIAALGLRTPFRSDHAFLKPASCMQPDATPIRFPDGGGDEWPHTSQIRGLDGKRRPIGLGGALAEGLQLPLKLFTSGGLKLTPDPRGSVKWCAGLPLSIKRESKLSLPATLNSGTGTDQRQRHDHVNSSSKLC
jgi:hypothetical protein